MVVVKIMLSIRACLKFWHLFFRSCFSFFQMDRRKGDSLGGCRYQAKRHRANGETIVMPLDRLIHGEKSCNPPQSTVAAESSEIAHFPDPPSPGQAPSAYYIGKAKQISAWEKLRPGIQQAAFDRSAPLNACKKCSVTCQDKVLCGGCKPCSSVCHTCAQCLEICKHPVICDDCGPCYSVCRTCAEKDHKLRPLHTMMIWTVLTFSSSSSLHLVLIYTIVRRALHTTMYRKVLSIGATVRLWLWTKCLTVSLCHLS